MPRIPPLMTTYSIWAIWGFLILGSCLWLIVGSLKYWGVMSNEYASWVQAFGSVIAIIAAGAFPIWHDTLKQQREQRRIKELLFMAAVRQVDMLERLYSVVAKANEDFGRASINGYLQEGKHLRWSAHIDGLNAFPMAQLSPHDFEVIGILKVAAAYGERVSGELHDWVSFDDNYRNEGKLLYEHFQQTENIKQRFLR